VKYGAPDTDDALAIRSNLLLAQHFLPGEDDRARGASILDAFGSVELIEMVPEDREPHVAACADAKRAQLFGRGQQLALLAVVEIGNDVQALHRDTPSKQRSAVGDCTRDLGRSANGGTPLCPGRRVQSYLQRFTQAKNIKNIAVKKCASIIA